jgi:hypothetical protein
MTFTLLLLAIFLGFFLDGGAANSADLKSVVLVLLILRALPWMGSAANGKSAATKDPLLAGLIALYLLLMFQPAEWSAEAWNQVLRTGTLWLGLLVIGTWLPQPERKHRSASNGKGHRSEKQRSSSSSSTSSRSQSSKPHAEESA